MLVNNPSDSDGNKALFPMEKLKLAVRNVRHQLLDSSLKPYVIQYDDLAAYDVTPIVVFINQKSGGRKGKRIYESMKEILDHSQICDICNLEMVSKTFIRYKNCSDRLKLLCYGGDGTVNWLLKQLQLYNLTHAGIGLIPIGTGNDLHNVLKRYYYKRRLFALPNSNMVSHNNLNKNNSNHNWNCTIYLNNETVTTIDVVSKGTTNNAGYSSSSDNAYVSPESPYNTLLCYVNSTTCELDQWGLVIDPPYKAKREENTKSISVNSSAIANISHMIHDFTISSSLPAVSALYRNYTSFLSTNINKNKYINSTRRKVSEILNKTKISYLHRMKYRKDKIFISYFGIGVDAQLVMKFNDMRDYFPYLFFSNFINRVWYGLLGVGIFLFEKKPILTPLSDKDRIIVRVDGKVVYVPENIQSLVILNINSFSGGSKTWIVDNNNNEMDYSCGQNLDENASSSYT